MWSPCSVTCIPQSRGAHEADMARRWRVWLPHKCPNVKPPNQLTEFKRCSASIPQCLELESILDPSPRTIYRLVAIALLMLLPIIPSVLICFKYSSGFPAIGWDRNIQESPRTSIMEDVVKSDQLQSIRERFPRRQIYLTPPSEHRTLNSSRTLN